MLEFFLFLPFISGPAAIHVIAEKKKWAFTICDKLISGALLSNFMLIGPTILFGFFSNYLNELFKLYTLLSLSALILFLFSVLKKKKWHPSSKIKLAGFGVRVYLLLILLFALFVLFFHTIYFEYDAIYVFFPYAKSIALTGSMKYNVYDQSTLSTGMPPGLPVIYAWAFTTINDLNVMGVQNDMRMPDMLRPIPMAYFLLTALDIYLIVRETFKEKYAFLSVIIFMSFPSTILTLSAFTYYLDLGFVFYLVSAMLCLVRALKTRKPIWFFLTGVASSLLLLAKEPSVFIVPLVFSIFILFSSIRYRRAVFVILATLSFNLVFIWDIKSFSAGWVLMRQLPVFGLIAVLYCLSKTVKSSNALLTWKNLSIFLIPFIPSALFFFRGIVFLGSLYSLWGPALIDPNNLFQTATGGTQKTIDVAGFYRWDIPFLALGLGVLYLIPILFSIIYLFKKRQQEDKLINLLMLMVLFTVLETMAFTLVDSQVESRRIYYFAPLLAIFAANGLMLLDNFLNSKYFIYLCMLFNSLAINYVWLYRFPFQTMFGLSALKTSLGLASALDLAFFSLVFVGLFLLPSIAEKKLQPQNLRSPTDRFPMKRGIITLALITMSCLMVVYPTVPLWRQGAYRNDDFFSFQNDVYRRVWENGILNVSNYYAGQIDDHSVTVAFGGGALRYLANRSVIDLTTVMGVQSMQNMLMINTSGDLLQALNNSDIRYFLIPESNNSFYNLYVGFRESFYLFRLIEEDKHFSLIHVFTYYKLFRVEHAL